MLQKAPLARLRPYSVPDAVNKHQKRLFDVGPCGVGTGRRLAVLTWVECPEWAVHQGHALRHAKLQVNIPQLTQSTRTGWLVVGC